MVLITNSSLKLASIKYISKAEHSKYLRGFYKYLQCLKKNSGELRSAPCTWHQNALLSLPCDTDAMTSRICSWMGNLHRCSQDGVAHISELRVGLGTRRLRHSWCQEGGGGESLSQHEPLSLNSWWDTGTSLKENSSSHEWERLGKGGQIRELETTPCVICPVPSYSQGFCATMQVCMYVTIYRTWNLLFLPF